MATTRIYGASDNLIMIDGAITNEVQSGGKPMLIECSDGTQASIEFKSDDFWHIVVFKEGENYSSLQYSDTSDMLIMEGIEWVKIRGKRTKA